MMQKIKTRFTERFNIPHPIMSAPMDKVGGGKLAAAVTKAGGLGVIGGGYGDEDFVNRAFREAGNQPVGIGFIAWALLKQPELLKQTLDHKPKLFITSFGECEPLIEAASAENIQTAWQVQNLEQAKRAVDIGVDVIIAQGQEAGGHAMERGLVSLLPAVKDIASPDQIILAAGGIADGRGLASSLLLGADGVMMGTRFWASEEAEGPDSAKSLLTTTGGDQTIRSNIFDIARGLDWPGDFSGRVVKNDFSNKWSENIKGLMQNATAEQERYANADPEDYSIRALIAGEALDLINQVQPAGEIIDQIITEAADCLASASDFLNPAG